MLETEHEHGYKHGHEYETVDAGVNDLLAHECARCGQVYLSEATLDAHQALGACAGDTPIETAK